MKFLDGWIFQILSDWWIFSVKVTVESFIFYFWSVQRSVLLLNVLLQLLQEKISIFSVLLLNVLLQLLQEKVHFWSVGR